MPEGVAHGTWPGLPWTLVAAAGVFLIVGRSLPEHPERSPVNLFILVLISAGGAIFAGTGRIAIFSALSLREPVDNAGSRTRSLAPRCRGQIRGMDGMISRLLGVSKAFRILMKGH